MSSLASFDANAMPLSPGIRLLEALSLIHISEPTRPY